MNSRKQISNQINNYVTPQRSSSKAKDLISKNKNNLNLSNPTRPIGKLNLVSNKQEVPYLPRQNVEYINKNKEEIHRDLKYLHLYTDDSNNTSKQTNLRKASVDGKIGYATPKNQKIQYMSERNVDNYIKYNTNIQDKAQKISKTTLASNIRRGKFSRENAVVIIQRAFRNFLRRLRMNPKFEMSNLLKKKKLSILKNYSVFNKEQSLLGSHNASESMQFFSAENSNTITISKSNLKQEDKGTTEFLGNISKDKKFVKESPAENKILEKESFTKDNFIDDYESFVSYKKLMANEIKNNALIRHNDSINSKKEIPIDDNNLQQLKLSLDKFTDHYRKNSSCQSVQREKDDLKSDYLEKRVNTNHEDQTSIDREDISDTVNIYEKIFKEIKRDEKIPSEKSLNKKILNCSNEENLINNLVSNNNRRIDEKNSDIKIRPSKDELDYVLSNSNYDCMSSSIEPKIELNREIFKHDSKIECENSPENRDMIDKITQMLEREINKSDIENQLSNENKERIMETNNNMTNNGHNDSITENNKLNVNRSINTKETNSIKDETQQKFEKIHSLLEKNELSKNYTSILKLTEVPNIPLVSQINSQYTVDILSTALELKESKKTTEIMKTIIEELKKDIKSKEEHHKKELHEKLSIQKHEFDIIMQRQTGLIEGLLSEKKKLSQNSDEVAEKLENVERINHKKMQQIIENFDLELKKNKDAWFQAEKIRRKKWEDQKLKEIKEITVKGLEPEIERIISAHKQEISKMEDKLNEELRRQKEKLLNENERRISDIKERFQKEKEDAIEHERSLSNHRMRNQNERLEEEFNEDRRRWNSNLQAEIQRLETLREKDKKLYEDQLSKIEERNSKTIEEKENYYKNRMIEMEKRFEEKMKSEEENFR